VLDETGRVTGTVEKQPVSDRAICGAYYFKDGQTFLSAAEAYLTQSRYEEFFVSGVYDCMAAKGKEIRCFDIDLHISFGTPEEYAAAVGDPRLHEVEQG
jgi:dTDP-glucose pyrophosphorylase